MSYTNFDRHKYFDPIRLRFMSNIVNFFTLGYNMFDEFGNKLYGLYDGFLYDNLMDLSIEFIKKNEVELKADGNYVEAHRRKEDLKLLIEYIETLPVITKEEAISKL